MVVQASSPLGNGKILNNEDICAIAVEKRKQLLRFACDGDFRRELH